jgi:protein gp37
VSDNSKIEWTDHTFNPWWGCSRVSPACVHCYADATAQRWGFQVWRRYGERRMLSEANWARPLKWNRDAKRAGKPAKVFCASMADVFEDHPEVAEPRKRLWDLIDRTPWLTWQLLTKRPENVNDMVPWSGLWPANIWLGASVENQRFADQRIPALLNAGPNRGLIRFLSCEPLLGPVDLHAHDDGLHHWLPDFGPQYSTSGDPVCQAHGIADCWQGCPFINWVIIGGESGPKSRVTDLEWMRSLIRQCDDADVPVFVKQLGSVLGREMGAGSKGGDRDAWPDDVSRRLFPFSPAVAA